MTDIARAERVKVSKEWMEKGPIDDGRWVWLVALDGKGIGLAGSHVEGHRMAQCVRSALRAIGQRATRSRGAMVG